MLTQNRIWNGEYKWTFDKEQGFASNYFYLKILFQFKNLF